MLSAAHTQKCQELGREFWQQYSWLTIRRLLGSQAGVLSAALESSGGQVGVKEIEWVTLENVG